MLPPAASTARYGVRYSLSIHMLLSAYSRASSFPLLSSSHNYTLHQIVTVFSDSPTVA